MGSADDMQGGEMQNFERASSFVHFDPSGKDAGGLGD